jgi:hypothetical protein
MASPAEVRATLRAVLRAVDRYITPINGSTQWRKEVLTRFRAGQPCQDGSSPTASGAGGGGRVLALQPTAPAGTAPSPAQALATARDWVLLANNIAGHKELLASYNIGEEKAPFRAGLTLAGTIMPFGCGLYPLQAMYAARDSKLSCCHPVLGQVLMWTSAPSEWWKPPRGEWALPCLTRQRLSSSANQKLGKRLSRTCRAAAVQSRKRGRATRLGKARLLRPVAVSLQQRGRAPWRVARWAQHGRR